MLPYYEQGPLWNAYNSTIDSSTHPANITIAGVGIATLWCPSDPVASSSFNLSAPTSAGSSYTWGSTWGYVLPPGNWMQYYNSYKCCTGIFGPVTNQSGVLSTGGVSPMITFASITDGTSNTISFSEGKGPPQRL